MIHACLGQCWAGDPRICKPSGLSSDAHCTKMAGAFGRADHIHIRMYIYIYMYVYIYIHIYRESLLYRYSIPYCITLYHMISYHFRSYHMIFYYVNIRANVKYITVLTCDDRYMSVQGLEPSPCPQYKKLQPCRVVHITVPTLQVNRFYIHNIEFNMVAERSSDTRYHHHGSQENTTPSKNGSTR